MAVRIRLTRTGAKNDVCYRVIAADSRSPRDGRFLEILGWYDPKRSGINFELKHDRVQHWQDKGAVVSNTVKSLLKKARQSGPAVVAAAPVETEAAAPAAAAAEAVESEA